MCIHAKLPIRVKAAEFDRNQRIRATMDKARSGREVLNELLSKVLPTILEEDFVNNTQEKYSKKIPIITLKKMIHPQRQNPLHLQKILLLGKEKHWPWDLAIHCENQHTLVISQYH